jgi:hypothetical protein
MKRLLLFTCIAFFVISCNNNAEKSSAPAGDSAATVKYDYPYTL